MVLMDWSSEELTKWLIPTRSVSDGYSHSRIDESPEQRESGLETLHLLVTRAHSDAVSRLAALANIDLHPLGAVDSDDQIRYPDSLDTTTLQGYLGEILAGLIAENFDPHDRHWEVPAFLFRTHTATFQALERRRQLGGPARPIPGRSGDDCLAFARDSEGHVEAWLMCEAMCTHNHASSLIGVCSARTSHRRQRFRDRPCGSGRVSSRPHAGRPAIWDREKTARTLENHIRKPT